MRTISGSTHLGKLVSVEKVFTCDPGLTSFYSVARVALKLSDFELVRRLGDGSFAQVVLARQKYTHKQFAIKIIDKHLVLRHKQIKYIKNERFLLDKINYEGISDLYFTFQDQDSLYLGLELCPNGTSHLYMLLYHDTLTASPDAFIMKCNSTQHRQVALQANCTTRYRSESR